MSTVYKHLADQGQAHVLLEGIDPEAGLVSNWKTYASDLHDLWKEREEARIMEELAHDRDIPKAFQRYQSIQAVESNASESLAHELAKDFLANMNEVREGRRKDQIYQTFIRPLDNICTGFKPSEFILVGGRPAMGKTLLALQIAMNQAMAEIPVVFFTMEMSADILELLKDDTNYYGPMGKAYLSNSDIGALLGNPKDFGKSRPDNKSFAEGRYFHQLLTEPDKAKVAHQQRNELLALVCTLKHHPSASLELASC